MDTERSDKGLYSLIIYLPETKDIKIGKLGIYRFDKGYYIYTGSALNNLEARIKRHLSDNKKLHWHIDYLLEYAQVVHIITLHTERKKLECALNQSIFYFLEGEVMVPKFGSTDCKCGSHLAYIPDIGRLIDTESKSDNKSCRG